MKILVEFDTFFAFDPPLRVNIRILSESNFSWITQIAKRKTK